MTIRKSIAVALFIAAPLTLLPALIFAGEDCCKMGGHKGDMHAMHEKHLDRMSKDLGLSDEQKATVEAAMKEKHEKMKAIHEETHAKINAVLTDEQKKKFAEMKEDRKEKMEDRMEKRKEKRKNLKDN